MSRGPLTEAEQHVAELLADMLKTGGKYRAGALLLTYDNGDALGCRIAHGLGLQEPLAEATAVHVTQLIRALRELADSLDRKIASAGRVSV